LSCCFFVAYLIANILKSRKRDKATKDSDSIDSIEIPKMRYAKSEIDNEGLEAMKSVVPE
jgi:uncharacterized membrane protein